MARIHVPEPDLGAETADEATAEEATADEAVAEDGAAPKPRKTRRGTRGGRNRRRRTAATPGGGSGGDTAEAHAETPNWEYVPMSEWGDEIAADE